MILFYLWARQAVKTTVAPKFGGHAQRWDRAGLGGGRAATKSQAPALPAEGGCLQSGDPWSPNLRGHSALL
jgi:hypothetical protein